MSLWYDSRRHEYAMDGKNGWFIKYCDKLAADLSRICEEHFKGLANRHTADDVDYDEEMTVKEKIDYEVEQRKGVDSALDAAIQAEIIKRSGEDDEIRKSISNENSAREAADTALGGRIDSEALTRQNADTALENMIDTEIERSKGVDSAINAAIQAEIIKRSGEDEKLQKEIDNIKTKGTWADPFLVSDPNANLSALTTPGIYYFDFDDFKEISDRGCYNRGYMEVAEVWGDNVGRKIISQKICTGFEGKVFYFERTVDTNKAGTMDNDTGWRQFETTSGTMGDNTLERRLELLEEKIKTKGTWADPFLVSDPNANLSALTTPGIYYFDFDDFKEISDRGCYNRGYMEVAEVWGDNISRKIISQKICTGFEGKVFYFERTVDTNKAGTMDNDTGWRQFETTSGIMGDNTLERRLELIEEKIKALVGGTAGDEGEFAKLKNDVAELKQSAMAGISAIGTGLKVEDNTLSVDCATADETSGAVKSGLK